MARRPLVMGNWKLNGSKAFTRELITGLKEELHGVTGCDVAIAHRSCIWGKLKNYYQAVAVAVAVKISSN